MVELEYDVVRHVGVSGNGSAQIVGELGIAEEALKQTLSNWRKAYFSEVLNISD